jgi:20S proteasome alpha/beta subunit
MTTLVGIVAEQGAVLFSDTQLQIYPLKDPKPAQKIYKPMEHCAIAICGTYIKAGAVRRFFFNVLGCNSADLLNEALSEKYIPDYKRCFKDTDMLIALYCERPILYHLNSHGIATRARRFKALGTGYIHATHYLNRNLNGNKSLEKAIKVGYAAERIAFKDRSTGGFVNYAIVTQDGVDREGLELTRKHMRLERESIERTILQYSQIKR